MLNGIINTLRLLQVSEFDEPGPFDAKMYFYASRFGGDQSSGAYIFRPAGGKQDVGEVKQFNKLVGSSLVKEFETKGDWTSFIRRQYDGDEHFEGDFQRGVGDSAILIIRKGKGR